VNVALRLISLCPPAFPMIHFAPRTQTVRESSFARNPTASNPISKFPCCRPFVFMVLRIAFPAGPLYSKTSALPPGCAPKTSFPKHNYVDLPTPRPIPFIINQLRTLVLSCSSFSHSHPLFSMLCGLFVQKQGGGVPSAARAKKQKGSRRSLILRAARGMAPCVRMRLSAGGYSTRRSMPAPLVNFSWPLAELRTMTPSGSVFPVWAMRTLERP
jgi:hypothetical protein